MYATAIISLPNPNSIVTGFVCSNQTFRCRNTVAKSSFTYFSSTMKSSPLASKFSPMVCTTRFVHSSVFKRFDTVMEWQECKVKLKVDVPASVAYGLYSDRESIPRWMTFISSVKVLKDKPDLSRWKLEYKAFGQNLEYSWLARNLQPLPNQKIHWISLEGLPNRGTVRFFPLGPSSCDVELTFAYEVPLLLIPFASPLQSLMQGLIRNSLEQFAELAKSTKTT